MVFLGQEYVEISAFPYFTFFLGGGGGWGSFLSRVMCKTELLFNLEKIRATSSDFNDRR